MSRQAEAPGTLTALIEEVVRSTPREADAGAEALKPGDVVGRYLLLHEVGRGGFGVVWEARDRDLGRTVAFKVLRARGEPAREKRLLAEAEVAARLNHPNIVTVLDVGRSEHGVHLVQEFLSGAPLSRRLEGGPLPVREAARIAVELARGLAHAHAHGVVHRDLTPGNVQLCDDGQVKLLDLGMAAALGRRKLEGGTPAYMAPEQAAGEPEDERTDVYALGVLLYRMLTGQPPADVDAAGRPRSMSRGLEVPECPALAALVEAMLARRPAERPRDAGVVLQALLELEPTLPRTGGPSRVRIRRPPRARWFGAGVVIGLVAAGLVTVPVALGLGARRPDGGVAVAASSAMLACSWKELSRVPLEPTSTDLRWRNGLFKGQQTKVAEGRSAWWQASDWNQLFISPGSSRPDVFAVQASFLAPVADHAVSVTLHAFGDPVGEMDQSSSELRYGRGLHLLQSPGGVARFEWGVPHGILSRQVAIKGTLPGSFLGQWHTLRIEGSRSGCWLRALLDDQPLVIETGSCDLSGDFVVLGAGGEAFKAADVLWRDFRMDEGEAGCR